MMRCLGPTVALAFTLMTPFTAGAQTTGDDAVRIIEDLHKKILWISKQTATQAEYRSAEAESAEELRQLVAKNPSDDALTKKNADGVTPLMLASARGFADLVIALLESEKVRATINEVGQKNTTSWMFANFALRQTFWACRPQILGDPFSWIPVFEVQRYYKFPVDQKPYVRTRRALEAAGANIDLSGAKSAWLERCGNSTADTQAKVKESPDLMMTLEAEGDRLFELHHGRTLAQAALGPENIAPQTVKLVLDDVELPEGFSIKAPSPSLGQLPATLTGWWSVNIFALGEILFAFEEFVSPQEARVLMIAKGRKKPHRGRRLNMAIEGNTLSSPLSAESRITITVREDGKPVAAFAGSQLNATVLLRKAQ
ncbi:ankyrin repeat domain-containing protein [Polaromonas sp. YR568]|uniref:ankyrin repeat domain-containing protein n=1 Tax=Polaromonas sp. YR568 TaxID=1855301 RepID=UPI0031383DF8